MLTSPASVPEAIALDAEENVIFTTMVSGTDTPPTQLILEEVDGAGQTVTTLGALVDDGLAADLSADDFVYTGTFPLKGELVGQRAFRVVATHTGEVVASSIGYLQVTTYPVGPGSSDPGAVVVDPSSGDALQKDELLVAFVAGTTDDVIDAVVAAEDATVIGTLPGIGVYHLSIDAGGTAEGVFAAVASFKAYPEVQDAEPNWVQEVSAVTPDDPKFATQKGLQGIRMDEAWVVARSTVTVAVVDTGVDYNHEDLSGQIIKGHDYQSSDTDPMDVAGHGTMVAGVIAASTNNAKGIAGAAWGSRVLAVRGYRTKAQSAAAIRYAARRGAKVINLSFSGPHSTVEGRAVAHAVSAGALVVASAGNTGTETKRYPCGYPGTFCVASTTALDGRAVHSTYGSWVSIAAPGVSVPVTRMGNTYGTRNGTSFATPLVASAAAIVWSQHAGWTAAQVRARLLATVKPLSPALKIGKGRLDVFEAVFNGSFEIGDLSEWDKTGTCSSFTALGPLTPQHRKRFGYCTTGPSGDYVSASLSQSFTVQSDVTSIPIKFEYTFVTEEYPEWVGTVYDDRLVITLTAPNGTETELASETVNGSAFTAIGGIDFPGGDDTVGYTGWKTASAVVPVVAGPGVYTIHVTDNGDDIYDSVLLVDHIRMK